MSDKNIQVAKEIYAAFSRGVVPTIMAGQNEKVVPVVSIGIPRK